MAFKQGRYNPKNIKKYIGDPSKVRYMSSWELRMHQFLDSNPAILKWCSECVAIKYLKPTDKKLHRYFPDYYVVYKNKKGQILKEIIEVKPAKQTRRTRQRNPKQRLYEELTYAVNQAKWEAAVKFCTKYGIKFRVVTEKELFR